MKITAVLIMEIVNQIMATQIMENQIIQTLGRENLLINSILTGKTNLFFFFII